MNLRDERCLPAGWADILARLGAQHEPEQHKAAVPGHPRPVPARPNKPKPKPHKRISPAQPTRKATAVARATAFNKLKRKTNQ